MNTAPIQAFDWQRMFLGDITPWFLLEIVFRTTILFFYTVIMARFIGKRGMKQLTPFEYIIVIVLGSSAGDPMFYPDVPLLHGMTVITTVTLLEKLITKTKNRHESIEQFLESTPTQVVFKGNIDEEKLKQGSISREELLMQLRMQGIRNIGEVEYAYLEPSGSLSVMKYSKTKIIGESTFPPSEKETD